MFNKDKDKKKDEFLNNPTIKDSNIEENQLVLVERDLKSIIKDQKTNMFSYMTVSFAILVLILTIIKVKYYINELT